MPKFDSNGTLSTEVQAAFIVATQLSLCAHFAELTEKPVGAESLAKITLGPMAPAWDGGGFTKDQLANLLFQANIYSPLDSEKIVQQDEGSFCPNESSSLMLTFRRYARESELNEANGHNDLYMWLWNTVSLLETELHERLVAQGLETPVIAREIGPCYGDLSEKVGQGEYLWSTHRISWGQASE